MGWAGMSKNLKDVIKILFKGDNNNQGYVNYGGHTSGAAISTNFSPGDEQDHSITETEKSLKLRMRKRDAIMR